MAAGVRIVAPHMKLIAVSLALTFLGLVPVNSNSEVADARGIQFIALKSLARFAKSSGERSDETVLTSPAIATRIAWDELIVSWNADMPADAGLKIEARAICSGRTTKWFTMGLWSVDLAKHPRESVRGQKDDDGDVDTDTLLLNQPARRVQVRLTLAGKARPRIKFLSLSVLDTHAKPEPLPPNRAAWGKTIEVPERSQMAYENGGALCSPTTVSMLLAYWGRQLKLPALDHDVLEVVKGVFDPKWEGTGNWVFNTAYAGSLPGMRAYTTRLSEVAELEAFVARGIPVGLSLCYDRLRGQSRVPSGHLVVCVGFTMNGDVVINDPGTEQNVRKVFPRANLVDSWAYSKNAVYLIYPEKIKLPKDRFGHWDSLTSRGISSTN